MSLTAEQLNQRVEELSRYTVEDLEGMTVKALRAKVSGCGVTGIERDGKLVQVASSKKSELIAAIKKVTFKEKVVAQAIPDLTQIDLERLETLGRELDDEQNTDYTKIAQSFYEELRAYVVRRWDVDNQRWKPQDGTLGVLANQLVEKLRSLYRDKLRVDKDGIETLESHHHIRLNARTEILKRIEKYINITDANQYYFEELKRTFGLRTDDKSVMTFRRMCFMAMTNDSIAKVTEERKNDDIRVTNRSVLNLTPMLQKAHHILSDLEDNTPKTAWLDVALALVLVTGRRPYSEVLCGGEFRLVDEYELEFTGQAKTKGKSEEYYLDNPSYNIPTLVRAELAVKALEWLTARGKRINTADYPNDIQRAREVSEKRYSKDLSAHMKKWEVTLTVPSDIPKKVTPHTLRELYALAACRVYAGTSNYEVNYAAKILGHDKRDSLTAQKYQKDFLLSDDSICKL